MVKAIDGCHCYRCSKLVFAIKEKNQKPNNYLNAEVITNYSKFTFNINQCHLMAHQLSWHNGLGVGWKRS